MWLYSYRAGRYSDPETRQALLIEAAEQIIGNERQSWADLQERMLKGTPTGRAPASQVTVPKS